MLLLRTLNDCDQLSGESPSAKTGSYPLACFQESHGGYDDHHHSGGYDDHHSGGGYDDYHSGGGSDYHYGDDHHYRSDNGPEAAGESADQKDEGSDKKTLFGRFGQSLGNRLANLVSAIKTGRQPTASEVDDLKID